MEPNFSMLFSVVIWQHILPDRFMAYFKMESTPLDRSQCTDAA